MSSTIRYPKPICLTEPFGTELIHDVIQIEVDGQRAVLTFSDGSTEQVNDIHRFTVQGFIDYP